MVARLNEVSNDEAGVKYKDESRPRVDFFTLRSETDPFPDASLFNPIDSLQHHEIVSAVEQMINDAVRNGFPLQELSHLKSGVSDHMEIFCRFFFSGPPADIKHLEKSLVPNATPVRVRLRNYFQAQREFLSRTVSKLMECEMVYANPSSPWACAPLLVPKPGCDEFRFTVDLRVVNCFTTKHQYPMPVTEKELIKVAGSQYFATFDLSQSYGNCHCTAHRKRHNPL